MLNVVYLLLFNKNIFSLQFKVKYAKIKKLIYKIEGKLFNLDLKLFLFHFKYEEFFLRNIWQL